MTYCSGSTCLNDFECLWASCKGLHLSFNAPWNRPSPRSIARILPMIGFSKTGILNSPRSMGPREFHCPKGSKKAKTHVSERRMISRWLELVSGSLLLGLGVVLTVKTLWGPAAWDVL